MIPECNDIPSKSKRAPNKIVVEKFVPSPAELALKRALYHWREERTLLLHGSAAMKFYSADIFMHFSFIERIVELVHESKLETFKDITEQVRWCHGEKYGPEILELVCVHCPKPLLPSPFVSTPLARSVQHGQREPLHTNSSHPRAPPRCSACQALGHKSELLMIVDTRSLRV